jgi:hypothetical protein
MPRRLLGPLLLLAVLTGAVVTFAPSAPAAAANATDVSTVTEQGAGAAL